MNRIVEMFDGKPFAIAIEAKDILNMYIVEDIDKNYRWPYAIYFETEDGLYHDYNSHIRLEDGDIDKNEVCAYWGNKLDKITKTVEEYFKSVECIVLIKVSFPSERGDGEDYINLARMIIKNIKK